MHHTRHVFALFVGTALLFGCTPLPQAAAPTSTTVPTTAPATSAPAAAETAATETTAAPTSATAAPSATAEGAGATASDEDIAAGIQQTLDIYTKAYNTNDKTLLQQAVDPASAPLRRLLTVRFDIFQTSINAGGTFDFNVEKILTRHDYGFVAAQVSSNGALFNWTFREVDGKWLMSEPTNAQIGKKETIESEHFTFRTYPWADDVNPTIVKLMEQARDTVVERLGKGTEGKAVVEVRPTFASGGITSSGMVAYYNRDGRGVHQIVLYTPDSYVFGRYDPSIGWEGELLSTLVHEYTHLVNNASFTPIHRMSDWMVEGLAEYVSDNPRAGEVSQAVRTNQLIPIVDTSDRVYKQDLMHLTILDKDRSLAYGESYSLVAYIADTYGGLDGFWKMVGIYDKTQNFDTALDQAFGVTYGEFDKGWRDWLEQKYG